MWARILFRRIISWQPFSVLSMPNPKINPRQVNPVCLSQETQRQIQEWQRQHEDEPAPETTACIGCERQKPATELKRLWTGKKIVREYWHQECYEKAIEAALPKA
jgi:hypothetical protein